MRLRKMFLVFGACTGLITAGLVFLPASETQSMRVSDNHTVSFDRGDYKIVKSKYNKKTILSHKDLIAILRQAGFEGKGLRYAWAIAIKESTGRPMSHNKNSNTGDNSYGLFQINMIGSLGNARLEKYGLESNKDLFDPLTNARVAYQMSSKGRNWSAWTTSKSALQIIKDFPG